MEKPRSILHDPSRVHYGFTDARRVVIDVSGQRLSLLDGETELVRYPVSTSRFGLGSEPGSHKTPTGKFFICDMVGAGAPESAVFKGRELTGDIAPPGGEKDCVLTRILRLSGLEPHNANTYSRYIYIHGTNQESEIGKPASHGCIRMKNSDVVDLFARVRPGTPVEIRL